MLQYVLIIIIIIISVLYVKITFSYWTRRGVLQVQPSFPFGNMKNLLLKRDTFGHTFKVLHDYFKLQNQPIGGYYFVLKPELIIVDPELIKCVLTKDFSHFMDRGTYIDEINDPLSATLFALPGSKWRHLRTKLTPTFTSGKMKMMFSTVIACSQEMNKILKQMASTLEPIDGKDIFSRFTMDVIGSVAFGIECNTLKNPENEFRRHCKNVMEVQGIDILRQTLVIAIPDIAKFLGIAGFNPKVTQFFLSMVKQTIAYRETNNVKRNDFMQLLIELKSQQSSDDGITIEQIAAQCFVFFLAGFETSSTTMMFCLYELACNKEIQNIAREEVLTVLKKYNNEITYDGLMEMHYLDKCISETLRKYPPLPFLNREVTSDYKLPGKELIVKKGTPVVISLEGLHWDPEFYPKPEVFNPERFNEEEKLKRPHYSYLPFGEGPRICIGLRFGLMQTKIGLVEIIRNFKYSLDKRTKIPLVMSTKSFMTSAEDDIWINLEQI